MLTGARAHSVWRAAADSEIKVCAYFTSVHIPSFGRAVAGNAADSEMEVSAYFTSVHIPFFGRAVTGKRERSDASKKEVCTRFTSEHIRPLVQHCYTQYMNEWDTQTGTDRLSGQR